jgi:hypothetical protein
MNLNSYDIRDLYEVFFNCTREREMRTFNLYGNASFVAGNFFGGDVLSVYDDWGLWCAG